MIYHHCRFLQLLSHLTVVHCGKDAGLSHPPPFDQHLWRQSARDSEQLWTWLQHCAYGLHCQTGPGEMHWQKTDLYTLFNDLTFMSFDMVNWEALWIILTKLGFPRKFTQIIHLFHDGMTGSVLAGTNGISSAPFDISNVVKHGCLLASIFVNLFLSCIHISWDLDCGIYLWYGQDGSLFDL